MIERLCKDCHKSFNSFSSLQTRCSNCQAKRTPATPRKPIALRGRRTKVYETWRDTVARPYLVKRYGHKCVVCDATNKPLDIDHIKGRGSHPQLKMVLSNVQLLCRDCHRAKTDARVA